MAGPTECRLCGRSFERYGGFRRAYCRRCAARADREVGRKLRLRCKECGKAFSTARRTDRYCSKACSADGARRRNREHMRKSLADPEKRAVILARTRAAAAARRARKRGGRPPRAGSGAGRMRRSAVGAAEPSECRLCGRSFVPYGRTSHVYCRRCTARADREIARVLRVKCKECGKAFSTTSRVRRYCSKACSAEGLRRSRRESNRRRMADPEKRAVEAAQVRAWHAARMGGRDR